jgi:DNA-binding LytR/AlgR family response regulator
MNENKLTSPYGNDTRLFLLLIPVINLLNYYLTYKEIHLNWLLPATFLVDTLQGYAAWWVVRQIIFYLDKKWPYTEVPLKRLSIQLPSTIIAGVAVIALLTEFANLLASDKPVPIGFYTETIFLFVIWILVVNGIYIGLYFYRLWRHLDAAQSKRQLPEQSGLIIKSGKQDILVQFEEITCCYVDSDYVVIYNRSNRKYFLDQSLDKLEKQLPEQSFFRLNRQYIVHRDLVNGFERGDNGKINVLIKGADNLPLHIPVSRLKAPGFKEWFHLS